MQVKLYTPEEANAVLHRVRGLVATVVQLAEAVPELQDLARIAEYRAHRSEASPQDMARVESVRSDVDAAEAELTASLHELDELGVHLKDAQMGLIDFFAEIDGEMVELCWKLGEERVAHWHRVGEGYAGRRPLETRPRPRP